MVVPVVMEETGASESCRERGDDSSLCPSRYEFAACMVAFSASWDAVGVNPFMASRAACLGLYARDTGADGGEMDGSFSEAVVACQP